MIRRVALSVVAALLPAVGFAEVVPTPTGALAIPMPADTRLVKFQYDANNSYTILSRPQSHTNIQLSPGEELVTLVLGDTAQWVVSNVPGHIFIKPLKENIATSGTLVTSQRTYQLNLRSSPVDGQFYQQVSWDSPSMHALLTQQAIVHGFAEQAAKKDAPTAVVSDTVSLENVNFGYTVEGNAPFRPTHVFDDGRFTWIRMPDIQEMPALFMLNEFGEAELLNYTTRSPYFIVQRLVPGLLLRLGEQEVRIVAQDAKQNPNRRTPTFSSGTQGKDAEKDDAGFFHWLNWDR